MVHIFRSITILLVAVFLLMAGNGPLTTLVGVRLAETGAPPVVIGVIMSGYFAGLTLGSLKAARLIGQVGHIRAFAAFASTLSAAALTHALVLDFALWGVLRLIEGFCMAGLFMCVESWLNASATPQTRGQILAFYMIGLYVGQGAGQFLLNLEPGSTSVLFMLISILVSLALVPVALTRMTPPTLPDISSFSFGKLYRASPMGVFGTVTSGLTAGCLYGLAPVFANQIGLGLSDAALFMSALILGGIALQWPVGRLSDIFDRRRVIVATFGVLSLLSAAMVYATGLGQMPLMACAVLFGGVVFALYPLCVAHTNDYIDKADVVSASGGLILAYSIGATVGPLMASGVMTYVGATGLFLFTGVVGVLSLGLGLWRLAARPSLPNEEQGPYLPLPRTTPVLTPLDPRAEDLQLEFDFDAPPQPAPAGDAASSAESQAA